MIDWARVYGLLNDVTPLPADCGLLCGSVCCTEWEKGAGMYLLPGEETMFTGSENWLSWEEHSADEYEFCPSWQGKFFFVQCKGACPREKRPFACRTFPVAPYLTLDGNLTLRLEEAAAVICPLVRTGDINLLDRRFLARARLAWDELIRDPLIRDDVEWGSRRFDRLMADLLKMPVGRNVAKRDAVFPRR
ncbi:MAG TPA: hypothetical protein PK728_09540 [Bacillota bacterium]|nr:hypothetical protein [Bacillota bacterium]